MLPGGLLLLAFKILKNALISALCKQCGDTVCCSGGCYCSGKWWKVPKWFTLRAMLVNRTLLFN